jgi:hypothetical protein
MIRVDPETRTLIAIIFHLSDLKNYTSEYSVYTRGMHRIRYIELIEIIRLSVYFFAWLLSYKNCRENPPPPIVFREAGVRQVDGGTGNRFWTSAQLLTGSLFGRELTKSQIRA